MKMFRIVADIRKYLEVSYLGVSKNEYKKVPPPPLFVTQKGLTYTQFCVKLCMSGGDVSGRDEAGTDYPSP